MTIITTERLTLRPVREGDAPRFAELCNDETLARQTSRLPHPYTLAHAEDFVARSVREYESGIETRFAVCEEDIIIACTGVMPIGEGVFELGYWVGADARARGVATEAAGAVCAFAFERQGAEEITAGHFVDNPASGRVMEKLGFRYTGEIVDTPSLGRGEDVKTKRMALVKAAFAPPGVIAFR